MEIGDKFVFISVLAMHPQVLYSLKSESLLFDEESLEISNKFAYISYNIFSVGGWVKQMLGIYADFGQKILQILETLMVVSLNEEFISFVIHNHFQCWEVHGLPATNLVPQVARHSDQDMTVEFLQIWVTKEKFDLGIARNHFDNLVYLSDKLTSVGQDDNLDFVNACVDFHQTWNGESACFTTSIDGLKHEVLVWIACDILNRKSLDDAWLEVVHRCEALFDLCWNIEFLPCELLGFQINDHFLDL